MQTNNKKAFRKVPNQRMAYPERKIYIYIMTVN